MYPPEHRTKPTNVTTMHTVWHGWTSPCEQDPQQRIVRVNSYLRSLQDYDYKINTHHEREERYFKEPLRHFWERNINTELDVTAGERYGCAVRAFMEKMQP